MKNNLTKELQDRILKRRIKSTIINCFAVIITIALCEGILYFGARGIVQEMDRQDCQSFQFQIENGVGETISQDQLTRCELLGFNLK